MISQLRGQLATLRMENEELRKSVGGSDAVPEVKALEEQVKKV